MTVEISERSFEKAIEVCLITAPPDGVESRCGAAVQAEFWIPCCSLFRLRVSQHFSHAPFPHGSIGFAHRSESEQPGSP